MIWKIIAISEHLIMLIFILYTIRKDYIIYNKKQNIWYEIFSSVFWPFYIIISIIAEITKNKKNG